MKVNTDIVVNLSTEELNALCKIYNMLADLSMEEELQLTKRLNRYTTHADIDKVRHYLYDLYDLAGGDLRDLID